MKRLLLWALLGTWAFTAGAQINDWKIATQYHKQTAKEQLIKRLTRYATFDTQAAADSDKTPSTPGQLKLSKELVKELKKYGAQNVKLNPFGIVTGEIPATSGKPAPVLALLAHVDTPAEISGSNVKPQVHKNYQGTDLMINQTRNLFINPQNSLQLAKAYGHDIMTASGGTVLGADDKSGVAVIMTLVQYLYDHPDLKHGVVKIAFIPDGQTGQGAEHLDVKDLGADYAYTLRGGEPGELTTEAFSAKSFKAIFPGNRSIPSGMAMNSAFADNILMGSDFHTLLPRQSRPDTTSGRRGYIYLDNFVTQGDTTTVSGTLYAFSDDELATLTGQLNQAFRTVKAMHNKGKAELEITNRYQNFHKTIPASMITLVKQAMQQEEITPLMQAARSNTDGSILTFKGLPTVEVFAGQFNTHREREYADLDVMEASLRTVLRLVELWGMQGK